MDCGKKEEVAALSEAALGEALRFFAAEIGREIIARGHVLLGG